MTAGRAILMLALATTTRAHAGDVDIVVNGVRNDHGRVLAEICPEAQFLQPQCPWRASAPAAAGQVTIRIRDVPSGIYAAQAYHDENGNHVLDRNWLGIPTEGLGFSNDARFHFGPPRFGEAAFRLGPGGGRIAFALRYFD